MPNHTSRAQPKRNRGALSADRIFNSTSPIINKDIQSFLAACITNWSCYTEEEKKTIISRMPPAYQSFTKDDQETLTCPVTATFVAEDRIIRDNIATFQREVGDGYYTRTWQEKARKAMQERAEGKFDEYLKSHAEEMFGDNDEDEQDEMHDSDEDFDARGAKSGQGRPGKSSKREKRHTNQSRKSRMVADLDMGE